MELFQEIGTALKIGSNGVKGEKDIFMEAVKLEEFSKKVPRKCSKLILKFLVQQCCQFGQIENVF